MFTTNINQVIIGRLNSINRSYSVGNIDGLNFIACAIGTDVIVLTENFKQIQVVFSCRNLYYNAVTAISCCNESGKIGICCDNAIEIFEPVLQNDLQIFPYQWIGSQKLEIENKVDDIQWVLNGLRLLVFAEKDLILYQHKVLSSAVNVDRPVIQNGNVKFTLNSVEEQESISGWEIIWRTKLAEKIKHFSFTHDGTLFATCGENDPFVKIWYQLKDSQSFTFIYIQHPAPVCGFEWRRSGGHLMPRRLVYNALITWCEDNTARIWKEIPNNEPAPELNFINAVQNAIAIQHEREHFNKTFKKYQHSHRMAFQMRRAKGRLVHKLTHIISERKVSIGNVDYLSGPSNTADMVRSCTFADFSIPAYTPSETLVFCLVATINAETDCFLVPSMSTDSTDLSGRKKNHSHDRPFTVHWLNNKEYEFEVETHKILAETTFLTERNESRDSPSQILYSLHSSTSSAGLASELAVPNAPHQSITAPNLIKAAQQSADNQSENPSSKDLIDYKLEKLVRQLSKSCDILFTNHPIDGSLLTWTLEWLDDSWKQPIVSFASRIPDAFSINDAHSLSIRVNTLKPSFNNFYDYALYKKTESDDVSYQPDLKAYITRNKLAAENNEIYLLTEHMDGSLNLWRLQVDNNNQTDKENLINQRQNVSTAMSVINVVHGYQICELPTEPTALDILKNEGLFDASSLSNQLLPQYHPTQLAGLLNAGRIQQVRAVLLNVLRALRFRKSTVTTKPFGLTNATTNKQRLIEFDFDMESAPTYQHRRDSISAMAPFDIGDLEYDELDPITPLPLHVVLAADIASVKHATSDPSKLQSPKKTPNHEDSNPYDSLFAQNFVEDDLEIDEILDDYETSTDERKTSSSRNRKLSIGSINEHCFYINSPPPTNFTTKHSRLLTEMLTHAHLPGLTSVDQMHLLAVADTISHFSANSLVDRLTQANAALQPVILSSFADSNAAGYASAAAGMETVDECGLRFLMAKKQHEYLLRCLPLKQRRLLKIRGISTAYVIWAFHSNTEAELLNALPCCQKQQENWEELRSYGIAWWLNNAALRICIERVAKNAFQRDQNPLDAALFYLALKKKNVLTQLFKTVNDSRMFDFFREDFNDEKWKKAALKNAYILMSKQRFHQAVAFFLLGGSLKDAIQTILTRIHDLQLALVVLRLYETEPESQLEHITDLLCKEVLGCDIDYIQKLKEKIHSNSNDSIIFPNAKRDPFERSMALWIMKAYVLSAETLLEEAGSTREEDLSTNNARKKSDDSQTPFLPDIFNFYSFLRRHPLVIRQTLAHAGIITTTTDQFLTWTRKISAKLSETEMRLYLRTANAHLKMGCPLLALDVLSSLPEQLDEDEEAEEENVKSSLNSKFESTTTAKANAIEATRQEQEVDWSISVSKMPEDKLELDWSDDEVHVDDNETKENNESNVEFMTKAEEDDKNQKIPKATRIPTRCPVEFQQLKLFSTLSIMTDELNTLASGEYEVAGGHLRLELFCWLEKECDVLRRICNMDEEETEDDIDMSNEFLAINADDVHSSTSSSNKEKELLPLHEEINKDRIELRERVHQIVRRRNWLKKHQKLLHTLAAYCALNSERNIRLIAIQMELLLLILEVQKDKEDGIRPEPVHDIHSFPLLVSSLSINVKSPISPVCFMMDQCTKLLTGINEFVSPPQMDGDVSKVTTLYNLCQGLSFCVYQSLSNLSNIENLTASSDEKFNGPLTQRIRYSSNPNAFNEDIPVRTLPQQWPGVSSLIALLTRERLLDDSPPNLRLLLVQFFVSTTVSLFLYAYALYDSRLLYRLVAHPVDSKMFADVFGGGGERCLRSAVPIRPPPPKIDTTTRISSNSNIAQPVAVNQEEIATIRAKLHAKVFTTTMKQMAAQKILTQAQQCSSEQIVQCWISPRKHIVQYFIDKVFTITTNENIGQGSTSGLSDYDSDEDSQSENDEEKVEEEADYMKFQDAGFQDETGSKKTQILPHDSPDGYAWTLMRLALLRHICSILENFIELTGFDFREVARNFPKLEQVIRRLKFWATQIEDKLEAQPGGCPADFLPNMHVQSTSEFEQTPQGQQSISPLQQKYQLLIEPGNTPFEYDVHGVKPVRRLWLELVRQKNLIPIFIRYIFAKDQYTSKRLGDLSDGNTNVAEGRCNILSVIKLIHREHDPIVAFAVNSAKSEQIVLSTGRELQELNIERVLDEKDRISARMPHFPSTSSFLLGNNRAELDVHMQSIQRDPLQDNDDYQMIIPGVDSSSGTSSGAGRNYIPAQTSTNLRKRQISGIRRLESHCTLPYYISGSSDGSLFLWEWGVEQPLFIARMAGQYAKIVRLAFAQNGSRFAAVDGDGLLCLWQAQTGVTSRRPYFSQRCHNKYASDVKYLGQTSTLLITAGHSTGDQNVLLWDTIMPQSKSIVHSFVGHPDGAQCCVYHLKSQSIISGGKHGEINIWDVRQRQLRQQIKAFDSANASVKCICLDPNADLFAAGSNEGDIKIWSATTPVPQLLYSLPTEHASRSGFSLRQVASISLQGVQQMHIDQRMHMFSCGADNSLKIRTIYSIR